MSWQSELWLKSRQLQNVAGKVNLPKVNLPNIPNQMWLQGQRFLPNAAQLAERSANAMLTSGRLRSGIGSVKGGLAGTAISAALDKPMQQAGAWGGKHIAKGLVEAFVSNEEKQQFRKDFPSLYGKAGPDLPRQGEGAISYLTARSNAEKAAAEATDTATTTVAPKAESTTTEVSEQSRHAANTGVDANKYHEPETIRNPVTGQNETFSAQDMNTWQESGTDLSPSEFFQAEREDALVNEELAKGGHSHGLKEWNTDMDIGADAKFVEGSGAGAGISGAQAMQIAAVIADGLFNKKESGPVQGKSFQAPKETPGGYTGSKMAHADVWRMGNYHATAPWRWG